MPTVRIIVAQGPLQLLTVLSTLHSQAAAQEYQQCIDYLVLGGFRSDDHLIQSCWQIASIWPFQHKVLINNFVSDFLEGKFDFAAATDSIQNVLGLAHADVIYVCRNWQFINELFLCAYPEARKICYGDALGTFDVDNQGFYAEAPHNPAGLVPIDDAYLISPLDTSVGPHDVQIRLVQPEFFKTVVAQSAQQIEGLHDYCKSLTNQFGSDLTFALLSYEFMAGTTNFDDEIACALASICTYTQPNEAIVIKPHPRQIIAEQPTVVAQGLAEQERRSLIVPEVFKAVPIELFTPYLQIKKAITLGSSSCISLAYLSQCEVVVGYGEDLIRQFFVPKAQDHRLIYECALYLQVNQAFGGSFTSLKLANVKQATQNYHKHPLLLRPHSIIQHNLPVEIQEQDVVKWFHQLYYNSAQLRGATWQKTYWMGHALYKCPLDLWVYQEILFKLKPELIIECGTLYGGSALFFAQMCDLLGHGEIVSIDIAAKPNRPEHPRITYWTGSSTSGEMFERVRQKAAGKSPILVILDSDHRAPHVLDELRLYSRFVTPGSYVVVEDSNVYGHPVYLEHGPGPMEALQTFLQENSDFYIDRECEKFYLTMNPSGYLRRRSLTAQESFLSQLKHTLTRYQNEWAAPEALASLQQTRRQVAAQWLSLPIDHLELNYTGSLGQAHQTLLKSGVQYEPLSAADQAFLEPLLTDLKHPSDNFVAVLLAAMLYQRADQIALPQDLTIIPSWFLPDYLQYLFNTRSFFRELGEADLYYHYLKDWIHYLHQSIFQEPHSPFWREVLSQFVQQENFISAYFNEHNLQGLYRQRAELSELYLTQIAPHDLEYDFGGPSYRRKIRLGILSVHYTPTAETFAALPIYEYLSREFEVVLYSLTETHHPLEHYCRSCASAFRLLPPGDLTQQVQMIRADDLDLLFVAGNITAVTNPLYLLSLHRLARKQITSISSITTTGVNRMDYFLSGHLTSPAITTQAEFSEKLVKLSGSAHCFSYGVESYQQPKPQISREQLGIPSDMPVFISSANFFKLVPELIHTWAKILVAVPDAVLVLLPFGPNWSANYPKQPFSNHVSQVVSEYGIVPDRVLILDPSPTPDREGLKEYLKLGDVYLDSYPCVGTTSLIEPLQIGLPTISRQGSQMRGNMGAAILQALGLPELTPADEQEYINLAVGLGQNPELRQQLRSQVEERMAALPSFLDSRAYAEQIGPLFAEIHSGHLQDSLSLRELNLLLFPNWHTPEEELVPILVEALRSILLHPEAARITLLVDGSFIPNAEEADLMISSIAMELLLEAEVEVGPEIALLSQFGEAQWRALIPFTQARMPMEQEDTIAIARAGAQYLPLWTPD